MDRPGVAPQSTLVDPHAEAGLLTGPGLGVRIDEGRLRRYARTVHELA